MPNQKSLKTTLGLYSHYQIDTRLYNGKRRFRHRKLVNSLHLNVRILVDLRPHSAKTCMFLVIFLWFEPRDGSSEQGKKTNRKTTEQRAIFRFVLLFQPRIRPAFSIRSTNARWLPTARTSPSPNFSAFCERPMRKKIRCAPVRSMYTYDQTLTHTCF